MPITSEPSPEGHCRLCATPTVGEIIEIFGEVGKTRNLAKKIEECLPISVARGDFFPKTICTPCLETLEQFYVFREECMKSEQSFEATWKKVHPDQSIEFSLEPECCLQEVDPEESGNNGLLFPKEVSTDQKAETKDTRNNGLFHVEIIPQMKKSDRGLADFIITPILTQSQKGNKTHESKPRPNFKTHTTLPQVGVPNPDDYILMYEQQLPMQPGTSGLPEYRHSGQEDGEVMTELKRRNQVLPPMWDVYETMEDSGERKLLHRRYIINKPAFPCSLCDRCFLVDQGRSRPARQYPCYENDINYLNNPAGPPLPPVGPLVKRSLPNLLEIKPLFAKHKTSLVLGKKRLPSLYLASPRLPGPSSASTPIAAAPSEPQAKRARGQGQVVVNTKHQFVSHMIKREATPATSVEDLGSSVTSDDTASFNDLVIKNFYCELCNKYFPRRSSLKRHQRSHLLDKMYPCTRCDKIFTRNEHLTRHLMLHSEARPFQCQVCMKKYTRKEHVDRHILIHPQIPEAEFLNLKSETPDTTLDLSTESNKSDGLQQKLNMLYHSKVNFHPHSSPLTDMLSRGQLMNHRSYVCELCSHSFARKEHLQRHKRRMHTVNIGKPGSVSDESKPYSCPICGKTFTRKEHLVRHNKIHLRETLISLMPSSTHEVSLSPAPSTSSPSYSEPSLLSLVSAADGLDVSLSVVPSTGPTPVPAAPASVLNKLDISISLVDDLAQPTSAATSSDNLMSFLKPFTCEFCKDKRFTRKSHLVRHFKRIHPDHELGALASADTSRQDKVAFNADTFVSNEDEHLCKICNKHFSRRYHLNRHLKLHVAMKTGKIKERIEEEDKPFQCSSCRLRFHQYDGFQNHRCTGTEVGSMVLVGSVQGRTVSSAAPVALRRDRRRRSRLGLECDQCGDTFPTRKQLAKHKLTHRVASA